MLSCLPPSHACPLHPQICIYTYEMEADTWGEALFVSSTSRFQIYLLLNAALRSEVPERIKYWHPLLYHMMKGLKKMKAMRIFKGSSMMSRGTKYKDLARRMCVCCPVVRPSAGPVRGSHTRRSIGGSGRSVYWFGQGTLKGPAFGGWRDRRQLSVN